MFCSGIALYYGDNSYTCTMDMLKLMNPGTDSTRPPPPPLPLQSQTVSVARPPIVAPHRLPERRPRTRTVGDVFGSSTELTSSSERSFEDSVQSQGTVSLTGSTEGERPSPLHKSSEVTKPLPPPPVSAKPVKAKGPPPPKPKPLPSAGQSHG